MSDLVEALQEVRELYVREDYAARVKQVFREHLEALEPDALIEDTLYFNHSAIPDFKLTWGRGAKGKSSRDIFLRSSYAAVVAGKETTQITNGDPIFLSISTEQSVEESGFVMTKTDVSRVAQESRHSLLTDAVAFRAIAAPVPDENPLSSAVRSNFLRGGKGLVDEPIADRLRLTSQDTHGNVTDLIRENFFEDAVVRMERTALLVQWAVSPESSENELERINGSMSTEELRNVLPWLLGKAVASKDDKFWKALGSLFDLEQLEELATELNGYNLTNLVQANLATWSAKRAHLGLNVSVNDSPTVEGQAEFDESADDPAGNTKELAIANSTGWRFDAGTLGLALGSAMIRVSTSGNKLKSRPGSSTPKWSATVDHLEDYPIRSVSVSGIKRAFRVDARESRNVKEDLEAVVDSVEDTYFVSHVEIMLPGPSVEDQEVEVQPVTIDFAGAIAVADHPVQIGALVRATANIMANKQLDNNLQESEDS